MKYLTRSTLMPTNFKTMISAMLLTFLALIPMQAVADVIAGKYGAAQTFDVQRSPAFPVAGAAFTLSGLSDPFETVARVGRFTLTTGQYVQLYYTGVGGVGTCDIGIKLYNANGSFNRIIHNGGSVFGLGTEGYLHVSTNGFGTFISNSMGYAPGSTVTYVPTTGLASCPQIASYAATTTPLAIGQSATADTTPPVVSAPIDIYVSAVNATGTPVNNALIATFLAQASANDNVDGTLTPTNNAPTTFPIGVTMVTFTATDAAGNVATATATVTVEALAMPAITNMVNGATLTGTSQTFSWIDNGATIYRLLIGSKFGGAGFFDSGTLPAGTTSVTATALPEKGVPVYVRLYAWVGGTWIKTDQTYVGAAKPIAAITTPANGVTLAATSQTFSWVDTGADKYFLLVGKLGIGSSDLYSSGVLPAGTTSVTVSGLPNDGSTIYARLYTWGNGAWQTSDTSYGAMPNTSAVATPTNGSTLAGTSQTFSWVDTGAPLYYFTVGTALGRADIHQSGGLPAGTTSIAVTGLPLGGVPIYVRLYSWGNGSWNISNTTYTSAP